MSSSLTPDADAAGATPAVPASVPAGPPRPVPAAAASTPHAGARPVQAVGPGLPVALEAPPSGPSPSGAAAAPVLGGTAPALALALTMFVEAVGYGVVAPTLPFLARQSGARETAIGFLVGLYAAVGLLVSVPFGIMVNRYGRKPLVLLGLVCLTVASVGFVFAPGYGWLVVARFVQGVGATAIWVGALTMAADLTPSDSMGRSLAWVTGAWSLGFVVGPALGGIGSVRFPFVLYAALSLLTLLLSARFLPETGRSGVPSSFAGILKVFRHPAIVASAAATFALSFYYGTVEAFLPLLVDELHIGRAGIGLLFAVAGLPSIALPRVMGILADRIGDTGVILGGLVYAAIFNGLFLLMLGSVPLWLLFLMVGLVEVSIYVPAVAMLHRGRSNDDRIFATGSHSYAFSAGFFLGPLCSGLLLPWGGYAALFALLAAVMTAAVVTLAAMRRRLAAA